MFRKLSIIAVLILLAVGLTACGIQRGDENDKANVTDLTLRGFKNPILVNPGASAEYSTYSATAGVCRLTIRKDSNLWTVRRIDGKKLKQLNDVNLAMLQAHADDIGIAYCFQ
jgi:hypothetical protein